MGSCDRAGHDGAGGGDHRAWGGIDGERDGNPHGECDGQRGGGEGAVPGRRGECRESGDWGWAGVQLCVEHGGRGEWEPCIDGGGDGCGGERGHQRGGDGDGEQRHDGAGGGDHRAWGGIDGERDGNPHGECDGQRGGGEGAVPGRRGECRESGDWGWAGVQLCVEHGGRGEWEPCIDGGGDGCGGECGHQRGGDGDGEQCWDGAGDLGGEREWDHGEWGDDQLDDGQGGGFAGSVWADGELWIHERVEPGAEHDAYGDAERFSGLDDVPLSGIVAGWAGEFGEFRGLHLHHGGGSRTTAAAATERRQFRGERGEQWFGGDACNCACGIHGNGGAEGDGFGEFRAGAGRQRGLFSELL